MARAADVSDYTSRDLAMPDSHRTCVLLSAFINYLAHCQSQADIVQQVRDDAYAVRDKRDEVAKKAAAAQKALQELRSVRAAENDREKDLRFMVNAAAPDIIRLLQEKTELEQAVGKIKDDRDKLARRKVRRHLYD
jgi:predicted metal-dependent peptidase